MRAFDDQDIRMWHTRRMETDAEALGWVASWSQRWEAETDVSWALVRVGTDEAVGQVGLRTVFLEAAAAQMSYWLLPEARGQGLAVSGTRAVQAWAFSELGLQRLALQHSVHNARSCRVAFAAGFALEGTLRRYLLHMRRPPRHTRARGSRSLVPSRTSQSSFDIGHDRSVVPAVTVLTRRCEHPAVCGSEASNECIGK
ncbi:MAG: GNAT family N-acetyltransferase [Actinomycetota bacterium]|nr:GNAT family N-acetyltransferase [Actinomycetota bacterium]